MIHKNIIIRKKLEFQYIFFQKYTQRIRLKRIIIFTSKTPRVILQQFLSRKRNKFQSQNFHRRFKFSTNHLLNYQKNRISPVTIYIFLHQLINILHHLNSSFIEKNFPSTLFTFLATYYNVEVE